MAKEFRAREKAWKLVLKGVACAVTFWLVYEILSSVRMIWGI